MKNFAKIHFWYNSIFSEILRVALFLLLTSLVLIGIVYKVYPNLFITVFCLFLIFEVYFSQKINKTAPKTQVGKNSGDIFDSFSLEALALFETQKNPSHLLKHLMHLRQVKFVLSKADAQEKEVPILDFDRNLLASTAFNLAKKLNAKFVTT